MQDSSTQDICW